MSFRHAPGKLLVIGRFLEKIVSALLPFLTMLVSARFIDLVLNQRMEEAIRDACLLGALILCQRLGGNLDTWMRIHQRKVLFPYLDERMIGKISRIPYGFLENAEIQDALERVSKDPEEVLNGVLESGFSMVCFLISNGCLVVWLITQAPVWISPVIMVLLVGFGFFAVKGGQKQYEAKKEVAKTPGKGVVKKVDHKKYTSDADFVVRIIEREMEERKINIKGAPVIIAGGYGMGCKENFALLHELAEVLGGEVGASRAAVDAGMADHARQIGQTGVTVRPKLYIACGISGQIQHTAGMDGSSMIISINTDPEAPINKIADYAIMGDVMEVVPKMIKYYKQNSK